MTQLFSFNSVIADVKLGTTGATAASGAIVDTDGYECVRGIALLESTAATDRLTVKGGTATDAMSEYTGPDAGQALGTAPTLYIDVFRPKKRYIQFTCYASAGGKNLAVITELYGARNKPTSNATTVGGIRLYSPNSGTASTTG